jgi:dihydroorotase
MLDLVIRRGLLVDENGIAERTIGVSGGRVAVVLGSGEAPEAREIIDASGKIVLPGLVDAHVHFREPGLTHKEDFVSGSAAAAAGGVTTVMVMPTDDPLTSTPEAFADKRALGEGRSHVDFALQAGLGRDTRHVRVLADLGAISFELFQTGAPQPLNVDDAAELVACLEAVREVGGITGVTPGSASLLARYSRLAREQHGAARAGHAASWPPEIEAMGVATACFAAGLAGARIHLRQVSTGASVSVLSASASPLVTAEVTPHNLVLDDAALHRLGPVAKVAPPLRHMLDVEAVRGALARGQIDIVATDHAPHTPEEKAAGEADIWQAPGGFPGVQTLLPLMLRLVGQGVLDYPRLVAACAATPARIFGLYPRKGSLTVGADADMVLIDPERPMRIDDADQVSKARRSPFHGLEAPATPVLTLLRGRVVMRDGRPVGSASGQFVRGQA